jgi:hypothetical protein
MVRGGSPASWSMIVLSKSARKSVCLLKRAPAAPACCGAGGAVLGCVSCCSESAESDLTTAGLSGAACTG